MGLGMVIRFLHILTATSIPITARHPAPSHTDRRTKLRAGSRELVPAHTQWIAHAHQQLPGTTHTLR